MTDGSRSASEVGKGTTFSVWLPRLQNGRRLAAPVEVNTQV